MFRVVISLFIPILILAAGCSPSRIDNQTPAVTGKESGLTDVNEVSESIAGSLTPPDSDATTTIVRVTEEEPVAQATEKAPSLSNLTPSSSESYGGGEEESVGGDSQNSSPESNPISEQTSVQPVQEGSAPLEEQPENDTTSQGCIDKAAFFEDVTIPDDTVIRQGESFEKVWRVRNEGTCVWGEGYTLVFAGGENMDGPLSNLIPVIAPGQIANISVILRAPSRGGAHVSKWEFQNAAGNRFGIGASGKDIIYASIIVNYFTNEVSPALADNGCPAEQNVGFESEIISLVNEIRVNNGLNTLEAQDLLAASALKHSQDMACNNFTNHTGSDGSTWYDRVRDQGFANYNSARENILWGNVTPQDAFDWWMNSTDHRNNILYPNVGQIGVGYVFNLDSVYGGYFTMVVARP